MLMMPKFTNPHSRNEQSTFVSRAELSNDVTGQSTQCDDSSLVTELEKLVQERIASAVDIRPRKRRKVAVEQAEGAGDVAVFCLLSQTPHPICLLPKPPPPPITREPACEDTEREAELRMKRARSVAVDFAWVVKQSTIPQITLSRKRSKVIRATIASSSQPLPALMVTEAQKSHPVRPPHLATNLFPAHALSSLQVQEPKFRCPVVPIASKPNLLSVGIESGSRRTKRSAERPPPAFWRPHPNWLGKCQGYAVGYPGHWSGFYEGDPRRRRYVRDTMRKGVQLR